MKKYFLKLIGFITSKFRKKMSDIDLLKQHAKTFKILFDGLSDSFGKGDFDSIKVLSPEELYFDFAIAGERILIKPEMSTNPYGTRFTVLYAIINHNDYPNVKLEYLKQFDFFSEKGESFKFTNALPDINNKYVDLDTFVKLLLYNLIGYLFHPNKPNFSLNFYYKTN